MSEQLWQANERHKVAEAEAEVRYEEASKKRLLRILQKKLHTSFIGALAKFEEFFGRIWGHGIAEAELNNQQRAWRALWEECRTEVLNNGNNQLRALQTELELYTVCWDKYSMVLPVLPPKEKETK